MLSESKDSKFTQAKEEEDEADTEVYFRGDIPDRSLGEELSKTVEGEQSKQFIRVNRSVTVQTSLDVIKFLRILFRSLLISPTDLKMAIIIANIFHKHSCQ